MAVLTFIQKIREQLSTIIVGQEKMIDLLLVALLANLQLALR